jgi:integrase
LKTYRRFIRIKGKLIPSPKFRRKGDAEDWYHQMLKKKHYDRRGLDFTPDDSGVTVIEYSRKFLADREKAGYPASTTYSDEQRLRDYILPSLAERPIAQVNSSDIRALLTRISKVGYRKKNFKISEKTRTRVQALLSAIFSDAMNEEPPLCKSNPVAGIKFKEARTGSKGPVYIEQRSDCLKFLEAARDLGPEYFVVGATPMMSGVRKQELIAAKWKGLDPINCELRITEK